MAREIVITSVPRGVRPGRTGFQIAMRTAGLREDVCDQLEALGVYRHLPPGVGPNPVCYFHKLVQTGIGPLQVLGRVLDAGADYSSRSNKLAHLVAIEAAELAGLRQSSPAAVLSAIEPRLARTWPGGPEERQRPFDLAGMPTEAPRICIGWQQAVGDAGWGGVLAEQAVKNKPVLLIAPDSSPEWCRRLLALFAEALALVPPARRWNVTFDTTILSAAPVTWRGTYAGSPESGSRQPGLLVVDLRERPAVPAEMAGLPLVQQARSGIIEAPVAGRAAPIASRVPVPPPVGDEGVLTLPDTARRGVSPTPPPLAPNRRRGRPDDEESNDWQAWVAWGVIGVLLLIGLSIGLVFLFDGPAKYGRWVARGRINACAQQADGRPPEGRAAPTVEDWLAAYGEEKKDKKNKVVSEGLDRSQLEGRLSLLNSLLLTKAVTPGDIKDLTGVKSLIERLERLKSGNLEVADLRTIDVKLPAGGAEVDAQVLTWLNPLLREPRFAQVNDVQQVQQLAIDLQPLAELVSLTEAPANAPPVPVQPEYLRKAMEIVLLDEDVKRKIDHLASNTDGMLTKLVGKPTLTLEQLRQGLAELSKQSAPPALSVDSETMVGSIATQDNAAGDKATADKATADKATADKATADKATADKAAADKAAADNEWQAFRNRVESTSQQWREWNSQPLDLVTDIKWTHLNPTKCRIVLASAGEWKPKAEQEAGKPEWKLLGVPGDGKKHWGTIKFDGADDSWKVTFKAEEGAPWVCGYVPIHFSHPEVEGLSDAHIRPLRIATKPQSLSWKVTGPANWAELAGFTAEGGMNADEATLAIDDQVLGLCAPRLKPQLKPQVVGKVGNLLVEQVPPQGPPNVMIVTYSSPRSQDSLNVVTRFTSEAQPLGVTVKPELTTSWTSLARHDFKGIEEIDWKNLADPKKPVWIFQWQRVVQGWTETMLPKASWNTDELMKRLGTRPIGGELESQYEPWGPIPPNIKSQKLHEWKKMAVGYVVKKGRHFRVKASNQEDDALRKAAENPAAVQEFLARETKWRADVEATFADDVQSKADQNELLALLVLAYLDGVVAIKSDPDSVRNAFGEKIADCVKAEVWIDWTFDGRPGLEEVQVAKVVGAAPDELNKK
jgi:hypothetical protein